MNKIRKTIMGKSSEWIPTGLLAIITLLLGLMFSDDKSFKKDVSSFMLANEIQHYIIIDTIGDLRRDIDDHKKKAIFYYGKVVDRIDTIDNKIYLLDKKVNSNTYYIMKHGLLDD